MRVYENGKHNLSSWLPEPPYCTANHIFSLSQETGAEIWHQRLDLNLLSGNKTLHSSKLEWLSNPVTVPKTISIEAFTIVTVDAAELTNPMTLFCDPTLENKECKLAI